MLGIVFLWVVLSIAVAILASNKGRSGFGWFVLSLVISPLIAGLFCAVSGNLKQAAIAGAPSPLTHVKCPDCAELVLADAKVCKHCGAKLIPTANHTQIVQAEARASAVTELKNFFIGIGAVAAAIFVISFIFKIA
jgi:hypothetical protein